jgi:predicted enzyme related to lactoylglutathione lyase
MGNMIVHVDIVGPDRKAQADWFSNLFDWGITHVDELNYTMFQTGPTSGGGFMDDGTGVAGIIPYIAVTDIEGTLDRAVAAGGKVVLPVQSNEFVTLAIFEDPFGHKIGLVLDDRTETPGAS